MDNNDYIDNNAYMNDNTYMDNNAYIDNNTYLDFWNHAMWKMEWLDIDKFEEDYDYTKSDDEGNWFDNSLPVIEDVILLMSAILYIVFLSLMPFWSKGIICYYYMLKAACLFVGCLLQFIITELLNSEMETIIHTHTSYTQPYSSALTSRDPLWKIVSRLIWASSFLIEEILAWIFLNELYLITCALESRKQQIWTLCKKVLFSLVVVLISLILFDLLLLVPQISFLWSTLISTGIPLHSLISSITTSFVLNFGSRIVHSLRENSKFRNENGLKVDKRHTFLTPLVVAIMIGQCLKFILRLVLITWLTMTLENLFSCLQSDLHDIHAINQCFLNRNLKLSNIQSLVNFEVFVYFWVVAKLARQN